MKVYSVRKVDQEHYRLQEPLTMTAFIVNSIGLNLSIAQIHTSLLYLYAHIALVGLLAGKCFTVCWRYCYL